MWGGGLFRAAAFVVVAGMLTEACAGGSTPTSPLPTATSLPTLAPSPTVSSTPTLMPSASPTSTSAAPATVGSIVPLATFESGGAGGTLLEADGAVWLFDWTGVRHIDPATNVLTPYEVQGAQGDERPSVLGAVGFGSLWVSDFDLDEVRRYDAETGELTATIETTKPSGLVATDDAIWVADHRTGSVSRIDPEADQVVSRIEVGPEGTSGPDRLFWSHDLVWAGIPNSGSVVAVDPSADAPSGSVKIESPAVPCGDMGSYGDRLFVSSCASARALGVVEMATITTPGSIEFVGNVTAPVTIGTRLWVGVGAPDGSSLTPFDPDSFEVGDGLPVAGGFPTLVLSAFDSLWVVIEHLTETKPAWLLRLPATAFQ